MFSPFSPKLFLAPRGSILLGIPFIRFDLPSAVSIGSSSLSLLCSLVLNSSSAFIWCRPSVKSLFSGPSMKEPGREFSLEPGYDIFWFYNKFSSVSGRWKVSPVPYAISPKPSNSSSTPSKRLSCSSTTMFGSSYLPSLSEPSSLFPSVAPDSGWPILVSFSGLLACFY